MISFLFEDGFWRQKLLRWWLLWLQQLELQDEGRILLFLAFSWRFLFFCGIVSLIVWGMFEDPTYYNFCVNGESLKRKEQSWCMPNESKRVRAEIGFALSCGVKFYRLKKSQLPEITFRHRSVQKTLPFGSESYKYYSFEMMPGGNVTATIKSSDSFDMCYLLKYEDFIDFNKSRKNSGFKYEMKGKGVLEAVFKPTVGNNYYFVVLHRMEGSASASFDLDFYYAVYNVSSKYRVNCAKSDSVCQFKNTKSDEMIIADNDCSDDYDAKLLVPGSYFSVGRVIGCVIIALPFVIASIIFGGGSFLSFRSFCSNIKKDIRKHRNERTTLLKKDTQTVGAMDSGKTPTMDSGDTPSGSCTECMKNEQELPPYYYTA